MLRPPLPSPTAAAFGLMLLSMALIPLGDSFAKAMTGPAGAAAGLFGESHGTAPAFAAFSRFAIGTLVLALLIPHTLRVRALRLAGDWRIWLRSLLLVGCIWSVITAAATEPLAIVFGAFFVGPLLSGLLAVALLGERMGRAQALCLALGFAAVLLVVRPDPDTGVSPGILFALLAGLCYGGFLTASRWLAARTDPLALLLTQVAMGTLMMAPAGLAQLPAPGAALAGLTLGSALASLAGNLALILAYRRAPAARLAPLVYAQLVAAALYGLAFFGERPDTLTLAGLALLIAAGIGGYLLAPRDRP